KANGFRSVEASPIGSTQTSRLVFRSVRVYTMNRPSRDHCSERSLLVELTRSNSAEPDPFDAFCYRAPNAPPPPPLELNTSRSPFADQESSRFRPPAVNRVSVARARSSSQMSKPPTP